MEKGEIYRPLKSTLLINWFNFDHALVDWGEINHLTGENRSGKTTIIDAIYLVMNADIKGRYFNAAAREATGRRQKRDLKGYMCKLINTDSSGNKIYARDKENFSSFVVLEFQNMGENKPFLIGFAGEYSARKGDITHRWFTVDGLSIRGMDEFADKETKIPLSLSALKAKFDTLNSYGNCSCILYDRMEDFLRARTQRFGAPNSKYFELFSKAISFRDMNIQEFIRNYICDEAEDTLKVESLESIIADYDRLGRLSKEFARKNELLTAEKALNDDYLKARSRRLSLEYAKEKLSLLTAERDQDERIASLENLKEQLASLKTLEAENEEERTSLSEEYELILEKEKGSSKSEESVYLRRNAREYSEEKSKWESSLHKDLNEAVSFGRAWLESINALRSAGISDFSGEDGEVASALASVSASTVSDFAIKTSPEAYSRYCDDISEKLYSIRDKAEEAEERHSDIVAQIRSLSDGAIEFPEDVEVVRARLESELGTKVPLACEKVQSITSDYTSGIEAYLGDRRFAFLLEEGQKTKGEEILRSITSERTYYIVDEAASPRCELSSVMEFSDERVKSYFESVLRPEVLSSETFYEDGAFVRLASDSERCLGTEAVASRRAEAENERSVLESELRVLRTSRDALQKAKSSFRDRNLIAVLCDRLPDEVNRIHDFEVALAEVNEKLDIIFSDPELMDIAEEKARIHEAQNANIADGKRIANDEGRCESMIQALERQIPEAEKRINEASEKVEGFMQLLRDEDKDGCIALYEKWKEKGVRAWGELDGLLSSALDEEKKCERSRRSKRFEFIDTFHENNLRAHADDDEPFITFCREEGRDFAKAEAEFKEAEEKAKYNFRSEVLAQMSSIFTRMSDRIVQINKAIPSQYHYRFILKEKKNFHSIFEMIRDSEMRMVSPEANLFSEDIFKRYDTTITQLIALLRMDEAGGVSYRDCRNYFDYDLMFTDEMGNEQSLTNLIGIKSGGETQEPLYIALFASIAQACHATLEGASDTVRLVAFDEAFSKMDRVRIHRCLTLISQFHLQAIFLTPPEKIREVNTSGLPITTNIVINPSRKVDGASMVVRGTEVAFNAIKGE